MDIRLLNVNDNIQEISRIYEQSWKCAYKGIIPQEYLDNISSTNWVGSISRPGRYSLVVLENGKYIGTSSFGKSRITDLPEYGEIISIYLLPEYMGKGYGEKLLNAALDELNKRGYKKIYLWVLEENSRARAFYEKMGFVQSNRFLDDNIGGKQLREIQYCFTIH